MDIVKSNEEQIKEMESKIAELKTQNFEINKTKVEPPKAEPPKEVQAAESPPAIGQVMEVATPVNTSRIVDVDGQDFLEEQQVSRVPMIDVDLLGKKYRIGLKNDANLVIIYIALIKLAFGENVLKFLTDTQVQLFDYEGKRFWPISSSDKGD